MPKLARSLVPRSGAVRCCQIVALLVALGEPARAEHGSLSGGIGVGGGTGHSGPFHLLMFLDARGWTSRHLGVFATAIGYGIPDYRTHGSLFAGGLAVRWVTGHPAPVHSLELSAGLGRHHITGFTIFNSDPPGGAFDRTGLGWIVRAGGASRYGPVQMIGGLEAHGAPGQGFAVVVVTGFGLAAW